MLKAKFETSLGFVEVGFEKGEYNIILDSKEYTISTILIDEIDKKESIIKELYIGEIGGFSDTKDLEIEYKEEDSIEEKLNKMKQRYCNRISTYENWEEILREDIKNGNIWIGISLDDGFYGSPEYKLELVE